MSSLKIVCVWRKCFHLYLVVISLFNICSSNLKLELIHQEDNLFLSFLQFKLMLSHDGSGKGAAIVTAVANRISREKEQKQNAIPNGE